MEGAKAEGKRKKGRKKERATYMCEKDKRKGTKMGGRGREGREILSLNGNNAFPLEFLETLTLLPFFDVNISGKKGFSSKGIFPPLKKSLLPIKSTSFPEKMFIVFFWF